MVMSISRRNRMRRFLEVMAIISILYLIAGCGGGGGGGGGNEDPDRDDDTPPVVSAWERFPVTAVAAQGLLVPQVSAVEDRDGYVHIAFYSNGPSHDNHSRYLINHLIWDPDSGQIISESLPDATPPNADDASDSGIDNNQFLTLVLDQNNVPALLFQGGETNDCAERQDQGDVMINIMEGNLWSEYTGGIGFVERNPVFQNGLAGESASGVFDSNGDVHLCYQFFYEGCDSHTRLTPDLIYIRKSRGDLGADISETTVDEGNIYDTFGTAEQLSSMGYHCRMILDDSGSPVIFYYGILADKTRAIRMARLTGSQWAIETVVEIHEDWTVEGLSAQMAPDGSFGIAYYPVLDDTAADSSGHLRYATNKEGTWQIGIVDELSICGRYPSLAFDGGGRPAIAYYDIRPHGAAYRIRKNLKFALFNGTGWDRETVATAGNDGDIGRHNSLWFDQNNRANICTYSLSDHEIVLYRENIQ